MKEEGLAECEGERQQQKHTEHRQRSNSTLSGKQGGGLEAGETISTKSVETMQKQFKTLLKIIKLL